MRKDLLSIDDVQLCLCDLSAFHAVFRTEFLRFILLRLDRVVNYWYQLVIRLLRFLASKLFVLPFFTVKAWKLQNWCLLDTLRLFTSWAKCWNLRSSKNSIDQTDLGRCHKNCYWKFNIAPSKWPSQKGSSLPTIIFAGAMLKFESVCHKSCAYFKSRLRQLTVVMQPLSKRFLHRDANSQNILVQARLI